MRREVGWAAERARELLASEALTAILIDSTQSQKQNSPSLSGEIISGFIQAIESEIPIAYVRPICWDEAYLEQVTIRIEDIPANSRVFDTVSAARDWLCDATGCKAAPI